MKRILTIICAIALSASAYSQVKETATGTSVDGVLEIDKLVHDFGDVVTGSGPLQCEFKVKNLTQKPMAIYNVSASCGCTDVEWTREPIQPGKTGVIRVEYANSDGPYPFDKNVTAYFSSSKKPVVLKLRGVAHEKVVTVGERYPVHLGQLGLRETEIKAGNITQGSQKSDLFMVANLGKTPMKLSFTDVSAGLEIFAPDQIVAAGETAKVRYIVTADRSRWGKSWYHATPVVNGVKQKPIDIWSFTKEDFSDWTAEQRSKAAQPVFETNTFNFGTVRQGSRVEAEFKCKNNGKSNFKVYKVDSDWDAVKVEPVKDIAPGKSGSYKIIVDTSGMPEGEAMVIITMTTNTPNRPLVNLFIGGAIKK